MYASLSICVTAATQGSKDQVQALFDVIAQGIQRVLSLAAIQIAGSCIVLDTQKSRKEAKFFSLAGDFWSKQTLVLKLSLIVTHILIQTCTHNSCGQGGGSGDGRGGDIIVLWLLFI